MSVIRVFDDLAVVYEKIKSTIAKESQKTENSWIEISFRSIGEEYNLPQHKTKILLNALRIDPEVRYKYINKRTRFRPKEFRIGTVEEKVQDAKNGYQTELPLVEEKEVIEKLKDMLNADSIEKYYLYISIIESMKIKRMDQEWSDLAFNEYIRTFALTAIQFHNVIKGLLKANILKKFPTGETYKLTLTKQAEEETDKELIKIKDTVGYLYEGEITEELITNEEKSELPELQSARETIRMLMSQNVKQSKILMQHYKALDALVKRDEEVKKERQIFNLLNNNYNILQERYDNVEKTVREQKNKIDKDNKFFKAYFEHIGQEIELLQVELIGVLDKIKSTPAYKLNEQQVMNQFVMQANKIIAAHKTSIANYSEGYNAE